VVAAQGHVVRHDWAAERHGDIRPLQHAVGGDRGVVDVRARVVLRGDVVAAVEGVPALSADNGDAVQLRGANLPQPSANGTALGDCNRDGVEL
jgi:hypothetical protein